MVRKSVGMPVLALLLMSLGGLLLHLRIHPPMIQGANMVPIIAGVLSVTVIPVLFMSSATAGVAYLLNLATVIVGVVMMTLFAIKYGPSQATWDAVVLKSTLADILILLAKLPIAQVILSCHHPKSDT